MNLQVGTNCQTSCRAGILSAVKRPQAAALRAEVLNVKGCKGFGVRV